MTNIPNVRENQPWTVMILFIYRISPILLMISSLVRCYIRYWDWWLAVCQRMIPHLRAIHRHSCFCRRWCAAWCILPSNFGGFQPRIFHAEFSWCCQYWWPMTSKVLICVIHCHIWYKLFCDIDTGTKTQLSETGRNPKNGNKAQYDSRSHEKYNDIKYAQHYYRPFVHPIIHLASKYGVVLGDIWRRNDWIIHCCHKFVILQKSLQADMGVSHNATSANP